MNYENITQNVYLMDTNTEGFTELGEYIEEDFQNYHQPLNHMHHAAVHDRGIAAGLEVSGKQGAANVVISAGVAVDGAGQLIVLATNGESYAGEDKLEENEPVPLSLDLYPNRKVYVTIEFEEKTVSGGPKSRLQQAPWIRLRATDDPNVDDQSSVILAIAVIRADGKLDTLTASDAALKFRRTLMGIPPGELRIRRSLIGADPSIPGNDKLQETVSGTLKPGEGGGLQMTVATSDDSIVLSRDGGENCSTVEMLAEDILCRDSKNRDICHVNTKTATLTIGAVGNGGNLMIGDTQGAAVLRFTSSDAQMTLGTGKTYGNLVVQNASNGVGVRLDGAQSLISANKLTYLGEAKTIEVDAKHLRVHGSDLSLDGISGGNRVALEDRNKLLVINSNNNFDNGVQIEGSVNIGTKSISDTSVLSVQGIPLMTSATRKTRAVWMKVNGNDSTTVDLDLHSPRVLTAFVSLVALNPKADFDDADAVAVEVFYLQASPASNPVDTPTFLSGGTTWGPPGLLTNLRAPTVINEKAQIIRFRIRSNDNCGVAAIGVVMFE